MKNVSQKTFWSAGSLALLLFTLLLANNSHAQINSIRSPRKVTNGPITEFPYIHVGKISYGINNVQPNAGGSGSVAYDDYTILTAAHVVCDDQGLFSATTMMWTRRWNGEAAPANGIPIRCSWVFTAGGYADAIATYTNRGAPNVLRKDIAVAIGYRSMDEDGYLNIAKNEYAPGSYYSDDSTIAKRLVGYPYYTGDGFMYESFSTADTFNFMPTGYPGTPLAWAEVGKKLLPFSSIDLTVATGMSGGPFLATESSLVSGVIVSTAGELSPVDRAGVRFITQDVIDQLLEPAKRAAHAQITSPTIVRWVVGQNNTYQITTTAGSFLPVTGFLAINRPAWMNLNPNTGVLSGTPPATGSDDVAVFVWDKNLIDKEAPAWLPTIADPRYALTKTITFSYSPTPQPAPCGSQPQTTIRFTRKDCEYQMPGTAPEGIYAHHFQDGPNGFSHNWCGETNQCAGGCIRLFDPFFFFFGPTNSTLPVRKTTTLKYENPMTPPSAPFSYTPDFVIGWQEVAAGQFQLVTQPRTPVSATMPYGQTNDFLELLYTGSDLASIEIIGPDQVRVPTLQEVLTWSQSGNPSLATSPSLAQYQVRINYEDGSSRTMVPGFQVDGNLTWQVNDPLAIAPSSGRLVSSNLFGKLTHGHVYEQGIPTNFTLTVTYSDDERVRTATKTVQYVPPDAPNLPNCNFSLSTEYENLLPEAAQLSVDVSAKAGCPWTAVSHASWITVTSGSSGAGNGTVTLLVASNSVDSVPRSGIVNIGDKEVAIDQGFYYIPPIFNPTVTNITTAGGTFSLAVTAGANTYWTVYPCADWIQVLSAENVGSGVISYKVLQNFGSSRAGCLTIGGQVFTINQAGLLGGTNLPPVIISQPASLIVVTGQVASFSVTATGTRPLGYQWRKSGTNILGATNALYAITNAQFSDAGSYRVVVSNIVGSVTSSVAVLTMVGKPSLQFTAGSYVAAEKSSNAVVVVTRTGSSSGSVAVNYATANGSAIAGSDYVAKSGTLSWTSGDTAPKSIVIPLIGDGVLESNETFGVVLSNPTGGSLLGTPNIAMVTISDLPTPVIGIQPQDQMITIGSDVTFEVIATNATSSTSHAVSGGPEGDFYTYNPGLYGNVVIIYDFLSASDSIHVYHGGVGIFTNDDLAETGIMSFPIAPGTPTDLEIAMNESLPGSAWSYVVDITQFTYQWRYKGANIAGATNSVLTKTNVQWSDAGDYSVVVTGGGISVTSVVATLNIDGYTSVWSGNLYQYGYTSSFLTYNDNFYLVVKGYSGVETNGVLLRVSPTNDSSGFKVKSFNQTNGRDPVVTAAHANVFYGTFSSGGTLTNGYVFKMNVDGTGFTPLKNFGAYFLNPTLSLNTNVDGYSPSWVTLSDGVLYGQAGAGGKGGHGTVFRMDTDGGNFTVLLNLTNNWSLFAVSSNTIYGSILKNGVTLFKMNTNGGGYTEFFNYPEIQYGLGLALDGNVLYGSADQGGTFTNGTLFKVNTDGTGFTLLKTFGPTYPWEGLMTNTDGAYPDSILLSGKRIYGKTGGGGHGGTGTIFYMNKDGSDFTVLREMEYYSNYYQSLSTLYKGVLYGFRDRHPFAGDFYGDFVMFKFVLPPDMVPPVLNITSSINPSVTNQHLLVSGTTSEDIGVSAVYWSVNGLDWHAGTTTNSWANWTTDVSLSPWNNHLSIYAEDTFGNRSATNTFDIIYGNTFVVTTTNDNGAGSLRSAISTANATSGPDIITFAIPPLDGSVKTIRPLTPLLPLSDTVMIDGYTQPGAVTNSSPLTNGINAVLKIVLDGTNAPAGTDGLTITGDDCTVRGLVMHHWNHAIFVTGNHNVIEGNFLGTDASGSVARGNNDGLNIHNGLANEVRGNLASGNVETGLNVENDEDSSQSFTLMELNLVGTDATGTFAVPNTGGNGGVRFAHSYGNTIRSNVISGNVNRGIGLAFPESMQNIVAWNLIGTAASGTSALGNGKDGLRLQNGASANLVVSNVVSGNTGNGIVLTCTGTDPASENNTIQANRIGTDATSTLRIGNTGSGVSIGEDNAVAHVAYNLIGGTNSGSGNVIAYNYGNGITVNFTAFFDSFLRNSIYENRGIGIDLGGDGATTNDNLDASGFGANYYQNYPELTSAVVSNGFVTIQGTLNSSSNTTFRFEFFANTECNTQGLAQGRTYLGFTNVTTGGDGGANFTIKLPAAGGPFVTATATHLVLGNTSEFSPSPPVAVDSWSVANGGSWQTGTNWSLNAAPSYLVADTYITNGTTKTVTVNATTTNIPGTMVMQDLTLSAPTGSTNTLQIINTGTNVPFSVLGHLDISAGGVMNLSNALLDATSVGIDGSLIAGPGTIIPGFSMIVGSHGVGELRVTGGNISLYEFDLGFDPGLVGNVWITGGEIDAEVGAWGLFGFGQIVVDGGKLHSDSATLGYFTNATLLVSNGIVDVDDFFVAGGNMYMAGGTAEFVSLGVGSDDCTTTGSITVSGGSLYVTNASHDATLEVRSGSFTQTGGTVKVDRLILTNSCGHFNRTGGSLIVQNLQLNPNLDTDGDGLPNSWEQANGLDPLSSAGVNGANGDFDLDGQSNLAEFLSGTSPTNSNSALRITGITRQGNGLLISWMVGTGKATRLERSVLVAGPFTNIFSVTNFAGTVTNYLDAGVLTNSPSRFYRVRLAPP